MTLLHTLQNEYTEKWNKVRQEIILHRTKDIH